MSYTILGQRWRCLVHGRIPLSLDTIAFEDRMQHRQYPGCVNLALLFFLLALECSQAYRGNGHRASPLSPVKPVVETASRSISTAKSAAWQIARGSKYKRKPQ